MLLSALGMAQNARYDAPFPSVSSTSPPYLIANVPPNSPTVAVCSSPANGVPCTNYATTYTSAGVACPNGAQDTPQPQPSACQPTGDAQGNIGFWAPPGRYDYTVCINTQCYGPYTVTVGLGTASAVTLQTNGIPNANQTLLNFTDANGCNWTNPSGGLLEVACPVSIYSFQVNGSALAAGDTVNLNDSTPAAPANGLNVTWRKSTAAGTDSVSAAVVGDGNAAHFFNGTGGFTVPPGTYSLPSQYTKLRCQSGLGDGLNAIPAGTYLQSFCYNDSGVTWTITGIKCFSDNTGTSTLNAAGNVLGALLVGTITCNSAFASGTQSANVALTNGDYIKFTFVSDGASKQTTWVVSFTQ